jgi:P27 family predicted phage terminase small subunit
MRGRKPKPLERQIAEGDPRQRGVKKLEARLANVPKATVGLPACPRHLRGRARHAWNFWSEELAAIGLDRRPDAMMLEGACIAYESMVNAMLKARELGDVVAEPVCNRETGEVIGQKLKKNPWVSIREHSASILRAFCSEFGLSPVSRQRLSIEASDTGAAELAELLARPRLAKELLN